MKESAKFIIKLNPSSLFKCLFNMLISRIDNKDFIGRFKSNPNQILLPFNLENMMIVSK